MTQTLARDSTTSLYTHKVRDYMANNGLSPVNRVFKQVERHHSHERYQRTIYAVFAFVAFLALVGSFTSFFFGSYYLGAILLCGSGVMATFNQWLTNTIPEHKVSVKCESEPCKQEPEVCLLASPRVTFHGKNYEIKHQPISLPILPPSTHLQKPVSKVI